MGRATIYDISENMGLVISIHALRGEGDPLAVTSQESSFLFQSTPSVGRATPVIITTNLTREISIHALRGEGDIDSAKKPLRN
mgnify:CR=1 FL=1